MTSPFRPDPQEEIARMMGIPASRPSSPLTVPPTSQSQPALLKMMLAKALVAKDATRVAGTRAPVTGPDIELGGSDMETVHGPDAPGYHINLMDKELADKLESRRLRRKNP